MENTNAKNLYYREEKKNAEIIYRKIGPTWCPTLDDHIIFNAIGFRHIVRKRGVLRSNNEQLRRFSLIPFAKKIIENPCATALHNKRTLNLRTADFWTLTGKYGDKTVRVVIRQLDGGTKHFFSVY